MSTNRYLVKFDRDFTFEELPFEFEGFWSPAYCFIRVKAKHGKCLILCAQLPAYTGTSITNGVENIVIALARTLVVRDEAIFQEVSTAFNIGEMLNSFFRPAVASANKDRQKLEAMIEYVRKSLWIEHYPMGLGLAVDGSYAIVNFDDDLHPDWNYRSREYLCEKFEFDENDLTISIEKLKTWNA